MLSLGLGDCIIANGLIREKCKEYGKVYIPCWTHNILSVQFMFSDLPAVVVQEVSNPNEIFIQQVQHASMGNEVLKLGCYSGQAQVSQETFDQAFYRQADVDFSRRWDAFKLPEITADIGMTAQSYAIICDDELRGFTIDDKKINSDVIKIRLWKSQTLFDFIPLLSEAKEIHAINSAPAILADSIPTKGKLFMHRYARPFTPYDNFKLRKPWKILT